jgi:C4-dicarboxylate transporter DctQ subunit
MNDVHAPSATGFWHRIDDMVVRGERAVILFAVAGMTLLVGADVVQRTFSRPVGKTAQLVVASLEAMAGPLAEGARANAERGGEGVFVVAAFALLLVATHQARHHTAQRENRGNVGLLASALWALLTLVLTTVAIRALLFVFPSSVPGAQKLALALMLWAGMLGASMATRERRHIVLDALKKRVPEERQRLFALTSGFLTASFCGFITLLSTIQLLGEIEAWAEGDNIGMFDSVPLPTWLATLAVPAAFAIMSVRFFAYAIRDFRFGPPKGGDGGHGVDLDALAEQDAAKIETAQPERT